MPDYVTKTHFLGRENVTTLLTRIDNKATVLGNKLDLAFNRGSASAGRFKSVVSGILTTKLLSQGTAKLAAGVGAVATEYVTFDDAITAASAKFKDIDVNTDAGRKKMDALRLAARKAGAETEFSAGQGAQAIDFLAMAGFNAEQSMAALPGVTELATVANVDLARSTDIASDSLGAFNLMSEDSATLGKNFARMNDVMSMTMSRTNTGIEDLFESIKKGAPAFTAAGQSLETFNTMAGIMANSGVKGAESGTQLRNVMLQLAKPTDEAQKTLDMLGVRTADARGNFRDAVDILEDVERGLQGMGTEQKSAALATIFGARSVTGINILLATGTQKIRDFRGELYKSAGTTKEMAAIMRSSLGNQIKSLQSAAIELGFKLFSAFHDKGVSAIVMFTDKVRAFDPQPIITGIGTALKLFTGLWNVITFLSPAIQLVIIGLISYGIVTKSIAAIGAIKHFFMLTKAIRGAAAAQGLLNLVMNANPIFLITTGVTLLIFSLIKLVKHWDKVKGFFGKVGRFFGMGGGKREVPDLGTAATGKPEFLSEETMPVTTTEQISPNARQAEAVVGSNIQFAGRLDIAGAPPGSTIKSKTVGAPPIEMAFLGINP